MKKWIQRHPLATFATSSALLYAVVAAALYWTGPPPQERAVTLTAQRFSYTPNIIEVNRGDRVTIRLLSTDVHHGFYLDGYEQETTARPGMDGSVSFVASQTGRYTFRCSMTCGAFHPYMVGYLRVKPDLRLLGSVWLFGSLLGIGLLSMRVGEPTAAALPLESSSLPSPEVRS